MRRHFHRCLLLAAFGAKASGIVLASKAEIHVLDQLPDVPGLLFAFQRWVGKEFVLEMLKRVVLQAAAVNCPDVFGVIF
jgi:hypothetical protein